MVSSIKKMILLETTYRESFALFADNGGVPMTAQMYVFLHIKTAMHDDAANGCKQPPTSPPGAPFDNKLVISRNDFWSQTATSVDFDTRMT